MESVKSTTVNWFGIENCAGRVQYDDPRMFHFKSWSPNTTFAPRINCPIFVDRIEAVSYTHLTLPTILLV